MSPGTPIEPAYAWGIVIPGVNGKFFLSQSTYSTRAAAIEEFGGYFEEVWRKGWKRAYRQGYRTVRVVLRPGSYR